MDLDKPVALIDLSSYIFYRFFAIQKWLSISRKSDEFTQDMIYDKFAVLFEKNLKDIKRKLKLEWKNIILVRDCPRDKIWRNDIYPEYKKTRDAKRSPLFDPTVFSHAYSVLVPKMINEYGLKTVQFDRAEADDIIAVVHNEVRRLRPNNTIYIISLDSDFLQLHGPHTECIDFQFKSMKKKLSDDFLANYITWKVIRGDDSDNIPPIDKKIGDITAKKLASNNELLQQKLDSSTITRGNYDRNNILINFAYIPESLRLGILELFKNM